MQIWTWLSIFTHILNRNRQNDTILFVKLLVLSNSFFVNFKPFKMMYTANENEYDIAI